MTSDEPGGRFWRIVFWLLALTEFAVAGSSIADGDWWSAATFAIYGALFLQWPFLRRRWIEIGYRMGRAALMRSAGEAYERGMAPHEWALAELERDAQADVLRRPRRWGRP